VARGLAARGEDRDLEVEIVPIVELPAMLEAWR
jgi:hypothetical protein